MNWFAFLMTVGSMSRLLTSLGSEKDLIKLRSYFALLKPNTYKTVPETLEDQLNAFFVSVRIELRHKFRYHNLLDPCQTLRSLVDYDVG